MNKGEIADRIEALTIDILATRKEMSELYKQANEAQDKARYLDDVADRLTEERNKLYFHPNYS